MNDVVRIKGTSRRGRIVEIIRDPDRCNWTSLNSPRFIRLFIMDADEEVLCSPAQLRK